MVRRSQIYSSKREISFLLIYFFLLLTSPISNPPTRRHLRRLVSIHNPDILFIAEPKSPSLSFNLLSDSFGFNLFFQSPILASSIHKHSPIWGLAKTSSSISVIHFNSSPHHLTLSISSALKGVSFTILVVHCQCDLYQRRVFWSSIVGSVPS